MPKKTFKLAAITAAMSLLTLNSIPSIAQSTLTQDEKKSIAEEAFIYAFPMIIAYGIMYEYSVDKNSGQYKGPFNEISNQARVYTPEDTAVVTPNSDTPYSFAIMDLRAEPMVLCVPNIEKNRYYAVQLTSQYTFNFGYIGSRTTGNDAGCYGVAGPEWHGSTPPSIKKMFRSDTEFAVSVYRTQLFNPADIDNVKKIQAGYTMQPLSQFLGKAAPPPAPVVHWPLINKEMAKANPFAYLNFLLQFAPPIGTAAVEQSLRARFAMMGIEAGKPFPPKPLTATQKMALKQAMETGLAKIKQAAATLGHNEHGWQVATANVSNLIATEHNFTLRAAIAMAGIYANDVAEALYPMTHVDGDGKPLDGSKHNYTLTFPAGQLPPVHAFWSVTMYDGKTQLLVQNPIHRYLINSTMLSSLKKNSDGSLTLYIQQHSPGNDKESNWLPAPNGPIYLVMRLYWPEKSALQGTWQPPAVMRD